MDIYTYIDTYSKLSFKEKEFTEVDNLIFSLLIYLDFQGIVKSTTEKISLQKAGDIFLKNYTIKQVEALGVAQKNAYLTLSKIITTPRYQNVLLSQYIYDANKDKQFSAITFELQKNVVYIAFEGTDELLSGWKENFQMSYLFPNPSQLLAIKYLNKNISLFTKKVIVGGHSKGGNLALVASMYCKRFYQYKIKKVYSNDGPGLRKEQLLSANYQRIKHKLIHFVPEYTVVGILLRNERYHVIKSTKKNIYAHDIATWKIIDDKLERGSLSERSKNIETSLILWLENHTDLEKEQIVTNIFEVLESKNIDKVIEIKGIKKTVEMIDSIRKLDTTTKKLMINLFTFVGKYVVSNSNFIKSELPQHIISGKPEKQLR